VNAGDRGRSPHVLRAIAKKFGCTLGQPHSRVSEGAIRPSVRSEAKRSGGIFVELRKRQHVTISRGRAEPGEANKETASDMIAARSKA
jgi:hypothetical protein